MQRIQRQLPFLRSVLKQANRKKREEQIQHANADQINAISEITYNLLRGNTGAPPDVVDGLKRYKHTLREVGKKSNSIKTRRALLLNQSGAGLWRGLDRVCDCLVRKP